MNAAPERLVIGLALAAAMFVAPASAASRFDVTLVEHRTPPTLTPGDDLHVALVLRNDGTEPWLPQQRYAVAAHWLDSSGAAVVWDGPRSPLGGSVAPGEVVRIDARLTAPAAPGEYRLQWDVVQEGVRWLSQDDPTPVEAIAVTVRPSHAFSVLRGGRVRWLGAGSISSHRLRLRNEGTLTWRADGSFALSYHWTDPEGRVVEWDGLRTEVPGAVRPGEEIDVEVRLATPSRTGRYRLQWDVVQEGVTWFSQRDPTPEMPRTVWLVPRLAPDPAGWTVVWVLVAVVATVVARRRRPAWLVRPLAIVDVVWCVGVLVTIQGLVLAEGGQTASSTGRLLAWAGASLLVLPTLLLPRRLRPWLCWSIALLVTLLLYADLVYQRFFGDILSLAVLGAARQTRQVRASVLSLLEARDLWLLAVLAAGLGLVVAVTRLPKVTGRRPELVLSMLLVAVVAAGALAVGTAAYSASEPFEQVFRNVYLAREVGVLNFHAWDLGRHVGRRREPLEREQLERVVEWFRETSKQRAGIGPSFGAARGHNLLMLQVESLQGFVLGLEVNGQQVTPFLNRWSADALLFDQVTDQTLQGRSSDAELATQVSLLPATRGAAAFRYPNNAYTGIASVLASRGYSTLSAVPFDGGFWNRQLTHPAFGFATNLFGADFDSGETIGWGLNDRDFLDQMSDRLSTIDEPFCAWLLTLSLHHPFAGFPDHHRELDIAAWEGTPFGNYLHTMSFFDRAFERMILRLEQLGLADRTVVVLWGDHDAGLDWRPELAAVTGRRHDAAGWYLSQRVPLLIRLPNASPRRGVRDTAAGHQDVAPTLLALLGVDPAPFAFVGRNLLGQPGGRPVVGEYQCWRDREHLFLQGGPSLDDGECFEIATLEQIDSVMCAEGERAARRQLEVSHLVLEHDLQRRVNVILMAEKGAHGDPDGGALAPLDVDATADVEVAP